MSQWSPVFWLVEVVSAVPFLAAIAPSCHTPANPHIRVFWTWYDRYGRNVDEIRMKRRKGTYPCSAETYSANILFFRLGWINGLLTKYLLNVIFQGCEQLRMTPDRSGLGNFASLDSCHDRNKMARWFCASFHPQNARNCTQGQTKTSFYPLWKWKQKQNRIPYILP